MNDENVLLVHNYDHDGISIVAAQGDVDLSTQETLRKALESSCTEQNAPHKVAVDMREVPFIDSAGLALLVEIRKRFGHKCQLALIIAARSQPERVLKLGRFDTFLEVCYSPDELSGPVASSSAFAPPAQ
ncbi:MAG: STAS domain-containing protein [Cytophagales bacterium]|nr:STAS domain-containing protein [Armatimonadota bacterium]